MPTATATASSTAEPTQSPSPTPSDSTEPPIGEDPIELAGTAAKVDSSLAAPDPGTFTCVFPADTPAVYVVYRLKPGLGGKINLTWRFDGKVAFEDSLQVPEGQWAYNGINAPASGFSVGDWEVDLALADTGGSHTVPFKIEPAN